MQPILSPYAPATPPRRTRLLGWFLVAAFCFIWGMGFALFVPYLLIFFLVPPVCLLLLVIWALPDIKHAPTAQIEVLFFAFVVALVLWPNYLSIALPGLPWISLIRIVGFPLMLCLLLAFSVSTSFRQELKAITGSYRVTTILLVCFMAIATASVLLSRDIFGSAQKLVLAQMEWTSIFFASCFAFSHPDRAKWWVRLLWLMAVLEGFSAISEFRYHHVPWAGHIPAFLKIDDPTVAAILAGGMRQYANIYRVQGTFSVSLALAEYLALVAPFVLHIAVVERSAWLRATAMASLPFIWFVAWLTNARSGMLGLLVGALLYALYWGVSRWRHRPGALLAPALVLSFPAIGIVVFAATLFLGRVRRVIWGGGETVSSTLARIEQTHMAIPLVLKRPWGYGIGQGAVTLNFHEPGGLLTIDNYYLSVLLEYGALGFVFFYGMLLATAAGAAKYGFAAEEYDDETQLLIPACVSLVVFLLIKSVLSSQENHPIVFMILGMVVALISRIKRKRSELHGAAATDQRKQGRHTVARLQPREARVRGAATLGQASRGVR